MRLIGLALCAVVYIAACSQPSVATAGLKPTSTSPDSSDPYAGRDGAAEALADIEHGKPLKLYSYAYDGEFPRFVTPDLLNCDPEQNIGTPAADALFSQLENAGMSEDRIFTDEQGRRAASAVKFGRAYNLEIWRQRKAHIVKLCPGVRLRE